MFELKVTLDNLLTFVGLLFVAWHHPPLVGDRIAKERDLLSVLDQQIGVQGWSEEKEGSDE